MTKTTLLIVTLAIGLFGFTGCGNKEAAPTGAQTAGMSLDVTKLNDEFASAGPEALQTVGEVKMALRYGQFDKAIVQMDKLANNPSLNEVQKKRANQIIDLLKQQIAKAPAPGGQ